MFTEVLLFLCLTSMGFIWLKHLRTLEKKCLCSLVKLLTTPKQLYTIYTLIRHVIVK